MQIHNLTPQTIAIVDESGKLIASYPPEEGASYDHTLVREGVVDGVIIYREKFRNTTLPPLDDEKLYIVDQTTANAAPGRTDFLLPANPVENEEHGRAFTKLILTW